MPHHYVVCQQMNSPECPLFREDPELILDRLGATPMPAGGPAAARVAGHAPIEHLLGSEAATPGGPIGDAVAAYTVHVSGSRAGERFVAARAVLQLPPGEGGATVSASPSHDCSYVLIF